MQESIIQSTQQIITFSEFLMALIGIITIYGVFKFGKKQVVNNYNTKDVKCKEYAKEIEIQNVSCQSLELTYCNNKPVCTNCIYWLPKDKCLLFDNTRCKLFS